MQLINLIYFRLKASHVRSQHFSPSHKNIYCFLLGKISTLDIVHWRIIFFPLTSWQYIENDHVCLTAVLWYLFFLYSFFELYTVNVMESSRMVYVFWGHNIWQEKSYQQLFPCFFFWLWKKLYGKFFATKLTAMLVFFRSISYY